MSTTSLKVQLVTSMLLLSFNLFSQGIAINAVGAPPDPSALLDLNSTTQGFLMPRMTTGERDAIVSPADGLIIFNTTTYCFDVCVNNAWSSSCPQPCTQMAAPQEGAHQATQTQITWNWVAEPGLVGYKWNIVDDFSSAIDMPGDSYVQTGLTPWTDYTCYVWAYNACSVSPPAVFTRRRAFACGAESVTFAYLNSEVTYGTVWSSGKCWLDRNLGATDIAYNPEDDATAGDLFQWGRLDDGHQLRISETTSVLSESDVPGHNLFITTGGWPDTDWRTPGNDLLWQGADGINNPCPDGWRVPTIAEWIVEWDSWSQAGIQATDSPLKLSFGRQRFPDNSFEGNYYGFYWSSTTDGPNAQVFHFSPNGGQVTTYSDYGWRAIGMSVRCITD